MRKRLTETAKWSDPWFRGLSLKHKALWQWLVDNCDCAGVLPEIDWGLASFQIGETCSESDMAAFGDRVEPHGKGWWLPKFVAFQVGYFEAHTTSKPLIGIMRALDRAGIPLDRAMQTLSKGLSKGLVTLKDKDKDKEKEKDSEKGVQGETQALALETQPATPPPALPDRAELIYQAYPRKIGKADALRAIRKALEKMPADKLLEATKAYAVAVALWPPDEQMKFTPHPATWFNRGSYEDDRTAWCRGHVPAKGTPDYAAIFNFTY